MANKAAYTCCCCNVCMSICGQYAWYSHPSPACVCLPAQDTFRTTRECIKGLVQALVEQRGWQKADVAAA